MADSACLLRSFSHPSTSSPQHQQVDPIRALTESVSFGRFMSEPLAWEKWSTFSHNRNLEEVQKFAKPGSVAQKRAFFEAHYKKRAAMRAAALVEGANTCTDGSLQSENADPMSLPGAASENAKTSVVGADGPLANYFPDTIESETIGVDARNPGTNEDNNVILNPEISDHNVNVEISVQFEVRTHFVKPRGHDMIVPTPETNNPYKSSADQKKSGSSTKRRRTMSARSSADTGASKVAMSCPMQMTPIQANNGNSMVRMGQKSADDSNNKRKMIPKTLHTSLNFPSCSLNASKASVKMPIGKGTLGKLKKLVDMNGLASSNNKVQSDSTVNSSGRGSKTGNNGNVVSKESVRNTNEIRRVVSKSSTGNANCSDAVGKSVDFISRASMFSRKAVKIPRESSRGPEIPNRASVAEPKHLPRDMISEDRSGSKSPNGSKAHAVTKSSPFRFRSEERAERRKEFFQKVEERSNSVETGKQNFKGKTSSSLSRLWQSREVKLNGDLNARIQSSNTQRKKIPLTRPGVHQACTTSRFQEVKPPPLLPPRRPARSTCVGDKTRRNNVVSSVIPNPKVRRENASPNIQPSDSEAVTCKQKNSGSVSSG